MIGRRLAALSLAALLTTGCASGPRYACGVPGGVTCRPVSAVYAAGSVLPAVAEEHAGEAHPAAPDSEATESAAPPKSLGAVVATVEPGDPVLTAPRVLRLWIAPWEDDGGDLHDETYLYLRLDAGRWTRTR